MTRAAPLALALFALGCGGPSAEPFPGGPNGLAFDARGRLHVASLRGGEIVVADPETGAVLERLGRRRGIRSPDDLAFGPDGSLYWTSPDTGEVGRLPPGGEPVRQAVGPGVNPIAFSGGGRLFVARPDALYELDPRFARPPRVVLRHVGPLNGMTFGPDGRLYAPVYTRGEVVRIDVDARTVEPVATGFEMPAAVKFDREGRLHLVDHATGCVWRLDPARELLARLDPPVDNLAFDARGRLFVSHSGGRAVLEVLPGGGTRRVIAPAR